MHSSVFRSLTSGVRFRTTTAKATANANANTSFNADVVVDGSTNDHPRLTASNNKRDREGIDDDEDQSPSKSMKHQHSSNDDDRIDSDNDDADDETEEEEESGEESVEGEAARTRLDMEEVRKQLGINASSLTASRRVSIPQPILHFGDIVRLLGSHSNGDVESHQGLSQMLTNIEQSSFKEPTPIQMQAIPSMMKRMDVLACAPTGSGKTAAYLIPTYFLLWEMKQQTRKGPNSIKCVIVVPTRELSSQVLREMRILFGGLRYHAAVLREISAQASTTHDQFASKKFDVIISTPMRLVHAIKGGDIDLGEVRSLILDEADKLFESDFLEQVDDIIGACKHPRIQRSLWSATMPQKVGEMARSILRDGIRIEIGNRNAGADTIDQTLLFVGDEDGKLHALRHMIAEGKVNPPAIFFLHSKERARELQSELAFDGLKIDSMHGERTQSARDLLVQRFREGKIWFLISSDILSRGVDFRAVNTVVNIDFPRDAVSYIHRIGRTGRAGRKGKAITFFTIDEIKYLRSIANVVRLSGCDVPDWMLQLGRQKSRRVPGRKGCNANLFLD